MRVSIIRYSRSRRFAALLLAALTTSSGFGGLGGPQPPAQGGAASGTAPKANDPNARPVGSLGLVEQAGISLTLIDVEVNDKKGRPMRGLKKADFSVSLNGRDWPIYSVDDLCTCDDSSSDVSGAMASGGSTGASTGHAAEPPAPSGAAGATSGAAASGASVTSSGAAPAAVAESPSDTGVRFVFFFDFGHLDVDGRGRAFKEARRWLTKVKQPNDAIAIYGDTFKAGLKTLSPFTSDQRALLASLDRAEKDPILMDTWPSGHAGRWGICAAAGAPENYSMKGGGGTMGAEMECRNSLDEDQRRGEFTMKGLSQVVESLQAVPGRKALILFNQTGAIETGQIYPDIKFPGRLDRIRDSSGDHYRIANQLAAEATLARTTINTAYMGDRLAITPDQLSAVDLSNGALSQASFLAEATGGRHNTDLQNLEDLTTGLRTRCACIYRIGLAPQEGDPHGRVHSAKIRVRGRALEPRYRVVFLNELDRWVRTARNVLRDPAASRAIGVGAALVPVAQPDGLWEVAVHVAFDMSSIEFVGSPGAAAGSDASWEAAALMSRMEDDKSWEMLGLGGAHSSAGPGERGHGQAVLHQNKLTDLKSGVYHLAAFVRDKASSHYGGAEADLELPSYATGGISTPVILLASRRHTTAPLPKFEKKPAPAAHTDLQSEGAIPVLGSESPQGESLVAITWLCPGKTGKKGTDASQQASPIRFIVKDGEPVFRLPEPKLEPIGTCVRMIDQLVTGELSPGRYDYAVQYQPRAGEPVLLRTTSFVIRAPDAPESPAVSSAN